MFFGMCFTYQMYPKMVMSVKTNGEKMNRKPKYSQTER